MRTTYKGVNRAKALKQYREILAHQKIIAGRKEKTLKEKFFSKPTRWERVKNLLGGFFALLALFVVSTTVFLAVLGFFMSAIH